MAVATQIHFNKLLRMIPGYDPFAGAADYWFDPDAAQLALDFFPECLTHIKGPKAGEPFELELWQQAIIANLFGWKNADGWRRYREGFIFVPRKNGKTPLAAGVVLYGLHCDGEMGAEIYSAAGDRDQAKIIFAWVRGMTRVDEYLSARSKILRNAIVAIDPETGIETESSYKPISSEAKTKHGYNTHIAVVDELHTQPNRELVDALDTSIAARSQPLILSITTSDFDRESICNEKYDYACKVRDGIIPDLSFLPVIYEASREDDWTDPAVWAKANPNLGVSVSYDYITAACDKAVNSPAFENTFKRLHLNIKTETDVRFLQMSLWDKCGKAFDPADLTGLECYGGLDMSSVKDFSAFDLYFPESKQVLSWFWLPRQNLELRQDHRMIDAIRLWVKQGFVKLTDGNVVDYDVVRADINKLYEIYNIKEIAVDRWNTTQITTQLEGDGHVMVPFGQGFASMSAPTKELERLVLSGEIAHGGNPVLRWMAANCSVEQDAADNMKPSKKKSRERIDGIVALIMGIGRAISQIPEDDVSDVYAKRGLMTT